MFLPGRSAFQGKIKPTPTHNTCSADTHSSTRECNSRYCCCLGNIIQPWVQGRENPSFHHLCSTLLCPPWAYGNQRDQHPTYRRVCSLCMHFPDSHTSQNIGAHAAVRAGASKRNPLQNREHCAVEVSAARDRRQTQTLRSLGKAGP